MLVQKSTTEENTETHTRTHTYTHTRTRLHCRCTFVQLLTVTLSSPVWRYQWAPSRLGCKFWSVWACHGNQEGCAVYTGWIWRWQWRMTSCTWSLAPIPPSRSPAVSAEGREEAEMFRYCEWGPMNHMNCCCDLDQYDSPPLNLLAQGMKQSELIKGIDCFGLMNGSPTVALMKVDWWHGRCCEINGSALEEPSSPAECV